MGGGERSRLARRYSQALELVAERKMRMAVRFSRSSGGPAWPVRSLHSRIALRYMTYGGRRRPRGGVAACQRSFRTARIELGAVPEDDVVALAERLRLQSRAASEVRTALVEDDPIFSPSLNPAHRHGASGFSQQHWSLP